MDRPRAQAGAATRKLAAPRSSSPPPPQSQRLAELPTLRLGCNAKPVPLRELERRKGERHADWIRRIRRTGVLARWPAVLDGRFPVPLAPGIREEFQRRLDPIRAHPLAASALLRQLCGSRLYLEALARPGAMRHDADGNPTGPVSDADREHAAARLRGRKGRAL